MAERPPGRGNQAAIQPLVSAVAERNRHDARVTEPVPDDRSNDPRWFDFVAWRRAVLFFCAVGLAVIGGVISAETDHDLWLVLALPLIVGYWLRWIVQDSPAKTRRNREVVRTAWRRLRGRP